MTVKIVNNNIVLHGVTHDDNGKVTDKFHSEYSLPAGHRPENVKAEYSKSRQMLTVSSSVARDPDYHIKVKIVD